MNYYSMPALDFDPYDEAAILDPTLSTRFCEKPHPLSG